MSDDLLAARRQKLEQLRAALGEPHVEEIVVTEPAAAEADPTSELSHLIEG